MRQRLVMIGVEIQCLAQQGFGLCGFTDGFAHDGQQVKGLRIRSVLLQIRRTHGGSLYHMTFVGEAGGCIENDTVV